MRSAASTASSPCLDRNQRRARMGAMADVAAGPQPKGFLRENYETSLICVLFVLFARTFVFQQSKIPTGSMEDTLLVGDYILVNRFQFAPAVFDWERALLPQRPIRRGDVVVFKYPRQVEVDYIKRVIGLPGEVVEIRDRQLIVDGRVIDEPYVVFKGGAAGDFSVCAINCSTVDDCPAPGAAHAIRCHLGSCYLDCEDEACPNGMVCTQFADEPGLVCMFSG